MNDCTVPEPSHWPTSMARFGTNVYGQPKYRIVFAPSVKAIVGGEFADGFVGYRVRPAYRHIGDEWIIEKWISAQQATGMTPQEYRDVYEDPVTHLCITGPYPDRGRYEYCETFNGSPDNANLDKLIALLEHSEKIRPADNEAFIREEMRKKEKQDDAYRFDKIKETLPAFGIRAASFRGSPKRMKSLPRMKSANELGLPLKAGPKMLGGSNHGSIRP